jgi:hypothetical protein
MNRIALHFISEQLTFRPFAAKIDGLNGLVCEGNDMQINKRGFLGGCFIFLALAFTACAPLTTWMKSPPPEGRPAKYVILMIGDGMGAWHIDV